jgi:hypothetical protein
MAYLYMGTHGSPTFEVTSPRQFSPRDLTSPPLLIFGPDGYLGTEVWCQPISFEPVTTYFVLVECTSIATASLFSDVDTTATTSQEK